jgi:CheY-like chemotaxis protein
MFKYLEFIVANNQVNCRKMDTTSKKIIIAEDSSVIQNLAKKILEMKNYKITTAKNGQKVLDLLEKDNYDVILMDLNMPVLNGIECAKQIRKMSDPTKANIPIIAISGNVHNYTEGDFKAVGINEFVPKPLNFDKLVDIVDSYVS